MINHINISKCNDITLCNHEECKTRLLSFKEWDDLLTWIPMYNGEGLFSAKRVSKFLYDLSRHKNKVSAHYCVNNFEYYLDRKDLWFVYRFKDFEIWREDKTIYILDDGGILVHK